MCVNTYMHCGFCMLSFMTGGQGTITGLISSLYLHHFNPEAQTQIIQFENRCFYLLSHLGSPTKGPKCYLART